MLIDDCSRCKDCKIAVENCNNYEPVVKCEKLKGRKKYVMDVQIISNVEKQSLFI